MWRRLRLALVLVPQTPHPAPHVPLRAWTPRMVGTLPNPSLARIKGSSSRTLHHSRQPPPLPPLLALAASSTERHRLLLPVGTASSFTVRTHRTAAGHADTTAYHYCTTQQPQPRHRNPPACRARGVRCRASSIASRRERAAAASPRGRARAATTPSSRASTTSPFPTSPSCSIFTPSSTSSPSTVALP
jgi:hypothetical protein